MAERPLTAAGAELEFQASWLELMAKLFASFGLRHVGASWRRRAAELRDEWHELERGLKP